MNSKIRYIFKCGNTILKDSIERDKVSKQFGDWQILKKFTSELVRNNYFKTMTKESNRVYNSESQ